MEKNEVILSSCYHTGSAYALGYDVNGKVELDSNTFTTLDSGINGGVMAALMEHRRQFNPNRDVKRFIVVLKPVEIISGLEEDEDYKLEDNAGCDKCGIDDRVSGCFWCQDCIDEDADICSVCGYGYEDCYCDEDCDDDNYDDEYYNEYGCNCVLNDSDDFCDMCSRRFNNFDDDNVSVTFGPLSAFARARWLKSQGKL